MNTTYPIYNGKSIRQIIANMHPNLRACKVHRNLYIKNCIEVFKLENAKVNLSFAECIRNSNFNLTLFYLHS